MTAADLGFLTASRASGEEPDWLAGDLPTAVARLEVAMIRRALASCGGSRTEAAKTLGIHRQLLHTKIQRYGLDAS